MNEKYSKREYITKLKIFNNMKIMRIAFCLLCIFIILHAQAAEKLVSG